MELFYYLVFGGLAVVVGAMELSKTSKDRINTSAAFNSFKNNYVFVYTLMMGNDQFLDVFRVLDLSLLLSFSLDLLFSRWSLLGCLFGCWNARSFFFPGSAFTDLMITLTGSSDELVFIDFMESDFATRAGDWLQGPYVYYLYSQYGFGQAEIGHLFIAGFGSSMLFGTIVGSLADKQ
ncbi:hypothetical protein ACLOJK_006238 [Asimina triloba]